MSIDEATMKLGQEGYGLCVACHGADGNGVPQVGPPLAGSEWVLGPVDNIIRMQFRGLQGPITVKGEVWDMVMAPMGPAMVSDANHTGDEKLAATLTYIRNSWGNEAAEVTPEQVAQWRGEIGQPMLTVADLIDPNVEVATPKVLSVAPLLNGEANPTIDEPGFNGLGLLVVVGLLGWLALCAFPVVGGLFKR